MIYNIWYDMIWYMMIYDMTWHDMIWYICYMIYVIWYMIWYIISYRIIYRIISHHIIYDIIYHIISYHFILFAVPTQPWEHPTTTHVNKPETVITVKMLLTMSENIARNMYSSQGTINYPTQLHLVGHCKNCIMMHGTMTSICHGT
jgi:hypothetical protein